MAANEYDLTYDDIQNHIGQSVLWKRNPGAWTTSQTNDFNLALKRGVRRVYFNAPLPGESQPHTWSFMRPKGTLTLVAGEVTLTDITSIVNLSLYSTLVRGPAADITEDAVAPDDVWITFSAGEIVRRSITASTFTTIAGFSVHTMFFELPLWTTEQLNATITSAVRKKNFYPLPDDFAGMASNGFTYRRDQNRLGQIALVNEQEIRRHDDDDVTGPPQMAAIVPRTMHPPATEPPRWKVMFYPFPDQDYELDYRYTAIPPAIVPGTTPYHWGGAPISELILASILDYAWQYVRDSKEKHADYLKCLETAVKQDRKKHPEHTHGRGSDSIGAGTAGYQQFLDHQRHHIPYTNITTNW